jgi:hypothetical protein
MRLIPILPSRGSWPFKRERDEAWKCDLHIRHRGLRLILPSEASASEPGHFTIAIEG